MLYLSNKEQVKKEENAYSYLFLQLLKQKKKMKGDKALKTEHFTYQSLIQTYNTPHYHIQ